MRKSLRTGQWALLPAIMVVAAILRFWKLGALGLVGDESYYWLWSRFPAWSYFDHPGGTAWLIWLSTRLGGDSELGIRWLNALLAVAHVALVYALGRRLFSPLAGLVAAAFVAVAAPHIIISRFVYTDSLAFFLLLMNLYLLWPVMAGMDGAGASLPTWRLPLIAVTGFLLLNTKLSVSGYVLSLGLGILLWRRDLLRDLRIWVAGLGWLLGVLPFVLWNARHEWAGMDWLVQQATQKTIPAANRLAAAYHVATYLTPPVVLFCALGLLAWRGRVARWLLLIALPLLVPVLLSPANSPRNLLLGCLPLALLAGAWFTAERGWSRLRRTLLVVLLAITSFYGVGTLAGLLEETPLPQSSVAKAIRFDSLGWPTLATELRDREGLILTVDYSAASQLWYYSGRPVYSHWGQYLVWGIPDFDEASIVSQDYVSPAAVSGQLEASFERVEGPVTFWAEGRGLSKPIYLWRVGGLKVDKADFLDRVDFFSLFWAERRGASGR